MEGMETLLNKINAATENYWELSLFYDDDAQSFRILDNNLRAPIIVQDKPIYEFNKKLSAIDNTIIGPDVLNIELNTDYPKMLFSQLAVSSINGGSLISNQRRGDFDLKIQRSVDDIFASGPVAGSNVERSAPVITPDRTAIESIPITPGRDADLNRRLADASALTSNFLRAFDTEVIQRGEIAATGRSYITAFNTTGFATPFGLSPDRNSNSDVLIARENQGFVQVVEQLLGAATNDSGVKVSAAINNTIRQVFASTEIITQSQAVTILRNLSTQLNQTQLNTSQISYIKKLVVLRIIRIIAYKKELEISALYELRDRVPAGPVKELLDNIGEDGFTIISKAIRKNANYIANQILKIVDPEFARTDEEIESGIAGPVFVEGGLRLGAGARTPVKLPTAPPTGTTAPSARRL